MWPFKKKPTQNEYLTPKMAEHMELGRQINEASQAMGRHYVDWVEPVKELKRQGNCDEAERILLACVDATERACAIEKMGVAPWFYEQLAIIYRQQKRYRDEVAILDRFMQQQHAFGAMPEHLADRLVKASRLWSQQQGTVRQ